MKSPAVIAAQKRTNHNSLFNHDLNSDVTFRPPGIYRPVTPSTVSEATSNESLFKAPMATLPASYEDVSDASEFRVRNKKRTATRFKFIGVALFVLILLGMGYIGISLGEEQVNSLNEDEVPVDFEPIRFVSEENVAAMCGSSFDPTSATPDGVFFSTCVDQSTVGVCQQDPGNTTVGEFNLIKCSAGTVCNCDQFVLFSKSGQEICVEGEAEDEPEAENEGEVEDEPEAENEGEVDQNDNEDDSASSDENDKSDSDDDDDSDSDENDKSDSDDDDDSGSDENDDDSDSDVDSDSEDSDRLRMLQTEGEDVCVGSLAVLEYVDGVVSLADDGIINDMQQACNQTLIGKVVCISETVALECAKNETNFNQVICINGEVCQFQIGLVFSGNDLVLCDINDGEDISDSDSSSELSVSETSSEEESDSADSGLDSNEDSSDSVDSDGDESGSEGINGDGSDGSGSGGSDSDGDDSGSEGINGDDSDDLGSDSSGSDRDSSSGSGFSDSSSDVEDSKGEDVTKAPSVP